MPNLWQIWEVPTTSLQVVQIGRVVDKIVLAIVDSVEKTSMAVSLTPAQTLLAADALEDEYYEK